MSYVKATARGSGYYVLYVDGEEVSRHTAEREAMERGGKVLDAMPWADVYYLPPRIDLELVLTEEEVATPPPPAPEEELLPPPEEDEDLIEWIVRNAPEPVFTDPIQAPNMWTALELFAETTTSSFLFKGLYQDEADGSRTHIGAGSWGVVFLTLWRRKLSLRSILTLGRSV